MLTIEEGYDGNSDDWREVWADLAPFVPDAGEMFPDAVEVMADWLARFPRELRGEAWWVLAGAADIAVAAREA